MKKSVFFVFIFSLPFILFSKTITFNTPGKHALFNLTSSTKSDVEIEFSLKEIVMNKKIINGEEFTEVNVPGIFLPNDAGKPNLPGTGRMIAIPTGSKPEIKIISMDTVIYKNVNISPAPVIPFEVDDSPIKYTKDKSVYEKDADYPENPVKLSSVKRIRGVEYVILGITPFQYNPVEKILKVFKNVKVRVMWSGGKGTFGENRLRSRFWDPILQSNLINYGSLPKINYNDESNYKGFGWEYVIIIPDDPDFIAWADTVKKWRTDEGIKTKVVKLSEIGGNTISNIENFVDSAYANWQVPPVAVLLMSDYQSSGKGYGITSYSLPHPFSGTYVTDNLFADVDNDTLPDIIFARMTAQNAAQLQTIINKGRSYEESPSINSGFYDHPLIACGYQTERWFQLCTEIVHGFLTNVLGKSPVREYNIYSGTPTVGGPWSTATNTSSVVSYFGESGLGYITNTIPAGINWNGGSAAGINSDINSGAFILQHRDHGSETGWGQPSYHSSDLNGLSNNDLIFVFSINCLTGRFDYGSETFSEKFHRIPHGALGVIAATQVSYSFVNDTYIFGLYDDMWPNFDPYYPESTFWYNENLRPGFANASGKYYLQSSSWPYNTGDKNITYNLFHMHGDPFTTLFSEVPESLIVSHPGVLPTPGGIINIHVSDNSKGNVDSARVCIYSTLEDTIWKRGWTDGNGDISFDIHPHIAGDTLNITVKKQNHFLYHGKILVVSGVQVSVVPDTIDVNTPTTITVTVMDSSGLNPEDSIEVKILGFSVSDIDTTNSSGVATFTNLNSPYGQLLYVHGRKISETYETFVETVWVVNANHFTDSAIYAYSDTIGITGYLMANIPGIIGTSAIPAGHTAFISGCGINDTVSTFSDTMETAVIPDENGKINITIAKSGYYIYQNDITVKDFKGYVTGVVRNSSSGDSLPDTRLQFFNAGADTATANPVTVLYTGSNGRFTASDSLLCGDYDIYLRSFGYYDAETTLTVKNPSNSWTLYLATAPQCTFSGTVTDHITGNPLTSSVHIYRTDNGGLYQTILTDSATGGTFSTDLPYFSYKFVVKSYHHMPFDSIFTLNTPTFNYVFPLDSIEGNILVIDDYDGSKDNYVWMKLCDKKRNEILHSKGDIKLNTSANKFYNWLTEFGYAVDTTNSTSAVGIDWSLYDAVVVSSGNDLNPLRASGIQNKITSWYDEGGKLLIEGGEVGYDMQGSFPTFATHVLHINDWDSDNAGSLTLQNPSHPVASIPNPLPSTIGINYVSYADEDALVLESDATLIYGTNSYPQDAGVLVYDNNPSPEAGQVVFYAFNIDKIDTLIARELVENSMAYLLAQELGPNCSIYGHIESMGTPNDEGTIVTATDGSKYTAADTTDLGGNYNIPVYSGTYTLYITKEGFHDTTITNVNVPSGGNVQVNANIYPLVAIYQEDFEDSSGGYTNTGDWQWGIPTSGPGNAHSGSKLWATNLSGNYSSSSNAMLTSPIIDLTSVSEADFIYYQWYNIEMGGGNWDGGNVKISIDGGTFNILNNVSPAYTGTISSSNSGIPNELGYTGDSGEWQKVTADLTSYTGHTIQLRWHFGSDGSGEYPGWYVDDVFVGYTDYTAGVEDHRPYKLSVKVSAIARKNVVINLALPKAAKVEMKVLDITGRVIKSKEMVRQAGYYTDRINLKRSGIYFIRTRALNKTYINKVVVF